MPTLGPMTCLHSRLISLLINKRLDYRARCAHGIELSADLISYISQLIDIQLWVAGDSPLFNLSPFLEVLSLLVKYLFRMPYYLILNVDHPCDTDPSIIHFALQTASMV